MSYYTQYIIDTFESIYLNDSSLSIGFDDTDDIQIKSKGLDFFNSTTSYTETPIWKNWNGTKIPFLFSEEDILPIITFTENSKAIINYDIISCAFFFLSSWQEYHSERRDQYGRFLYSESLQNTYNFITIPVVNYYFDILKSAIETISKKTLKRKLWPDFALAVSLSHDIDKINSGWLEGGFSELKKLRFSSFCRLMLNRLSGKDPWNNLSEIISIEKNLTVPSTFFFLTRKGNSNADYELDEVASYFPKILDAKSEYSLHASLGSCDDPVQLDSEKKNLQSETNGNRFHFLKFEPKTFVQNLDKARFSYDTSLGFAEHIGFRNGFCFPFKPYNISEKKVAEFYEIPLMIMDATLSNKSYMGNNPNKLKIVYDVINEVSKFNGLLTILWHNNYFSEYKYDGWKSLYIDLIEKLIKKNATFLTCNSITELLKNE